MCKLQKRVLFCVLTIFQLYHGNQFSWWKKLEYPERTTDHGQATGKLYHLRLRVEYTYIILYCVIAWNYHLIFYILVWGLSMYQCQQRARVAQYSYKPITNTGWVRAQLCILQKGCTRLATAVDKFLIRSCLMLTLIDFFPCELFLS
jgi:hypothetical protein